MDIWNSVTGMLRIELTAADPSAALAAISNAGITVHHATREDDAITTFFSIHRTERRALEALVKKKGYDIKIRNYAGFYWVIRRLTKRPVLMFGLVLLLFLSFYVPSRVFFVSVQGNAEIPTRLIIEKCEECGISFGASRRQVRSERAKNALMDAIPELQWAGVNTYGCTAVITVKERSKEPNDEMKDASVSSITALRDGVITRCTVTKGTQLCHVGQVVRAGQLLVSGYKDCGICIQAGPSEAEIYAQTQRELKAITPLQWSHKGKSGQVQEKYSLIIGKKRINFYKGSGISGGSCDKMYLEYYVTLPGGYILPVSIVSEVWTERTSAQTQISEDAAQTSLVTNARQYLLHQMTAGSILMTQENCITIQGFVLLEGSYACEEMIAQIQREENGYYE